MFIILLPRMRKTATYNEEMEVKNNELLQKKIELEVENNNLLNIKQQRQELLDKTTQEYYEIGAKRQEIKQSLDDLKETQQKAAQDYYNQALVIAENSFNNEIDKISDELFQKREEAKDIYLKTLEEAVQEFQEGIEAKEKEFSYWNRRIIDLQRDVQIALEAVQRKLEIEQHQDYYRICLTDEDIIEIKRLREVLPYLRDKTPLNKVIYKVYYERPLTDMIGRVVGPQVKTGIYKITNLQNQMCYIGQSTNIADRWKQHVKRGVGAEDWTQNKLYPAMYSIGVENFTFEIIEECNREDLNEREKYWTLYFHAQDFGYSIRKG